MSPTAPRTTVYTDGACLGNPGPGGWAWAVPGGRWRSGADARTTNQRMEIAAALDAARALDGPLEVVSDSTYVVNCFRDGWWERWLARGWTGAAKQKVANRDLWEPLVDLYRAEPRRLQFRWVKGHSTDPFNDLVDRLAVAAATSQRGGEGQEPPSAAALGPADAPAPQGLVKARAAAAGAASPAHAAPAHGAPAPSANSAEGTVALPRPAPGVGGVTLRSGADADADAVLQLWRRAGAATVTGDAASLRLLIARDPLALIVAEAGGKVVGSVVAGFDGWRATLHRLAVDPGWRRQGLGAALVGEAERRLRGQGARRAGALVVTDDAGALAFWGSAGYIPQAAVRRHVKDLR